jgi:hypothetical protein
MDRLLRREFIALVGGAGAGLFAVQLPRASLAQDAADWVTAFPRAPVHVAAWPAGRKVAVTRAMMSVLPPGGNDTITLIGRLG